MVGKMKGDLKGIDVGGDDVEEIGMDDEEEEDGQGTQQTNGNNTSAKWVNHFFLYISDETFEILRDVRLMGNEIWMYPEKLKPWIGVFCLLLI